MSLGGAVSEPGGQKGKKQVKNTFGMFFSVSLYYILPMYTFNFAELEVGDISLKRKRN